MFTVTKPPELTRSPRAQQGFTLFELVIAMTIVVILVTIAVPGMRQVIDSNRLTAYTNSMLSGAHLARSEAIKRNEPVAFCAGLDGCGGDWEKGWTVRDADGSVVASASNKYSKLKASGDKTTVSFDGEGLPDGSLKLDLSVEGIKTRSLKISIAGSVYSEKDDQ